ncbi:Type cbb3 cytochrome oxidase biogenesis protein CcoI; Copper-translocating P-type ATPase [bacterium endosymbiont of Bathymodiolus sp. 5 South]|nr:Type cbb3 cytochrome oxidase biogenesis protein CcoI; Copper-translocating P-type ATPase [bacterium endosymbiont of Bathymodiolus sp. 5 South]VVH56191.1 Type cbb3 cytochrome oxidase biogenesis protein CcoI; Copper-translocating P-type ATPase (EC [uncultured Gammaproteobacteria bacterium]
MGGEGSRTPAHHNLNNQQLKHDPDHLPQDGSLPAHHNLNNQQLKRSVK